MKQILPLFFITLFTLASAVAAPRLNRDAEGEQFVKKFSSQMIKIVTNKDRNFSDRSNSIRTLLKKNTAGEKIVLFMLGRYARKISRAEFPAYERLMEDYAMRVFINRMLYARNAHTAQIKVIGSKKRGSKEVIVTSHLSVEGLKEPLQIRWHLVRDKQGVLRMFNLGVEGFWLAQEQRSQFVNFIQKNGGDPKVLLPYLKKRIAQAEKDSRVRDVETLRGK